ncbi:hypothetical protein Tco_0264764 [Tanacetum coccineum]
MDDNKKMMRIDEVQKFSDGTLMRIRDKLDFMVKDFRLFKFNKGIETRKWMEDDKRRSEEFIEVIEKRLKIRRIFRSLESFVGGRLRDIDYRLISRTEWSVDHRPFGLFFVVIFLLTFFYFCGSPESTTIAPGAHFPSYLAISQHSYAPDSSKLLILLMGPHIAGPLILLTVARWKSRVTARPSSSSEFPIAPVTASPVGPIPTHRLASRHVSPHSSDHHPSSSSSSSDSSPVHSSGLDASDQAYSGSSTRDVSPRFILCYSSEDESTTSRDSSERPMHSSLHSAGPSHKRCRSPIDSVPSSTPVMGSLAPTRADLLPPRKRFRDSYSSEASIEEEIHVGLAPRDDRDETKGYELSQCWRPRLSIGIRPDVAPIVEEEIVELAGEDSFDSSGTRDSIVRSFEDMPIELNDAVHDFYHHMSERVSMIERIESLRLENLKVHVMLDIERDHVNSLRLHMSL